MAAHILFPLTETTNREVTTLEEGWIIEPTTR